MAVIAELHLYVTLFQSGVYVLKKRPTFIGLLGRSKLIADERCQTDELTYFRLSDRIFTSSSIKLKDSYVNIRMTRANRWKVFSRAHRTHPLKRPEFVNNSHVCRKVDVAFCCSFDSARMINELYSTTPLNLIYQLVLWIKIKSFQTRT